MLEAGVAWLKTASWLEMTVALTAENFLLLLLAITLGEWAARRYATARVAPPAPPLSRFEVGLAVFNTFLNTATTLLGLALWRAGIIRFRTDTGLFAWLDVFALVAIMDLAMYLLHRLAHHPWLFPWLHRLHHEYDRPRPLTLFVLHPFENISFGLLWLTVISLYPASWLGMSVYLALNLFFGTVGHLGVEPLPAGWPKWPGLKWLAGSTFHAWHHQRPETNFGFYTLTWDRLFGTLEANYWRWFGRLPPVEVPATPNTVKPTAP